MFQPSTHISYPEPVASDRALSASEIDPAHHAIIPSDEQQDLAFRSIRAIDPRALTPYGPVSRVAERRTPKGIRPMIWVRLNETKSAAIFEATLHTGQCVQAHVPFESWRLATCEPEAVRAAIQKAYLNLLRHKPDPSVVKPGMVSLKILSKHNPQHQSYLPNTLRHSDWLCEMPSCGAHNFWRNDSCSVCGMIRPAATSMGTGLGFEYAAGGTAGARRMQSSLRAQERSTAGPSAGTSSLIDTVPDLHSSISPRRVSWMLLQGFRTFGARPVSNQLQDSGPTSHSSGSATVTAASNQSTTSGTRMRPMPIEATFYPREGQAHSTNLIGTIDKVIGRAKDWSERKRKRQGKTPMRVALNRTDGTGGYDGGNGSGSGSGSGELTYSESRSSASSYTSERSSLQRAFEPNASTEPTTQETAPPSHPELPLQHFELGMLGFSM